MGADCTRSLLRAGRHENRIKEQQLGLFADRTSTRKLAGNQLRLYFSAFAYVMMETLRRVGLAGTKLARAQSWTLRVRLLKIGAQVRITSRKVWLSFSESYPYAALLRTALTRTSTRKLAGNQLRLYFSAFAYVMMETLRRVGLAGTKLARAQSWTLRVRLLKIGAAGPRLAAVARRSARSHGRSPSLSHAVVPALPNSNRGSRPRITSRKVWLSFSESYPYAALLRTALTQVQALPLRC